MGAVTSTPANRIITITEASPSTSKSSLEIIQEALKSLPVFHPSVDPSSDPEWADLTRLHQALCDKDRRRLEEALSSFWRSLVSWAQSNENIIHRNQTEIHSLLSEVRDLLFAFRSQRETQLKEIENLREALHKAQEIKDKAGEMNKQLSSLEDRLGKIKTRL